MYGHMHVLRCGRMWLEYVRGRVLCFDVSFTPSTTQESKFVWSQRQTVLIRSDGPIVIASLFNGSQLMCSIKDHATSIPGVAFLEKYGSMQP
jgi:hypothetical protein